MTSLRPTTVAPVEQEVHRPRIRALVAEDRAPSRDSFAKRRSEREAPDAAVTRDRRSHARAPMRKRSKSAREVASRRSRTRSASSGWGSLDVNSSSNKQHPKSYHRSPVSDKTHNRDVSCGRRKNRYRSYSRSPYRGDPRDNEGGRHYRPSQYSPARETYCKRGGKGYDSDGVERRGNLRGSNRRSISREDAHSDPGGRQRRSSPGSDHHRRNERNDETPPPFRRDLPKVEPERIERTNLPVPIAKKEWIKCDKYDGTVALDIFLSQFYNCAEYNGWTEVDKLAQLKAALRRRAAQILIGCGGTTLSFTDLIAKLQAQFGTAELSAQYRI